MNEQQLYKACLENNVDLQYKRLTLCIPPKRLLNKHEYQVHCEDSRAKFSKLYSDPEEAVDKFIELKTKLWK